MKWFILGGLLISHLVLLSLLTFTAWPEMLSYPYLLNHGFQIYRDAVIVYPPVLILLLKEFFSLVPIGFNNLKIIAWILIILADCSLYYLFKTILKNQIWAFIMIGLYIPVQALLEGNMLWLDGATIIPLSLGLANLVKWIDHKDRWLFFKAILFLTLATAIKQTAFVYFLPLIISYLLVQNRIYLKDFQIGLVGFGVVWLPIIIYLLLTNSLRSFWLWNFYYPLTEWSKFPGYVDFNISRWQVFILVSLIISCLVAFSGKVKSWICDYKLWTFSAFLIAALVAVYPRFSYFHLQPAIVCLFALIASINYELSYKWKQIQISLIFLSILVIVKFQWPYIYGPGQIRFNSQEDKQVITEMKNYVQENQTIYLLGPSSLAYVETQTVPTKPWIDNFGWYLDIPGVQQQLIYGLNQNKPLTIFWQKSLSYQPNQVISFINQSYKQSGKLNNEIEIWTRKD